MGLQAINIAFHIEYDSIKNILKNKNEHMNVRTLGVWLSSYLLSVCECVWWFIWAT